LANSLVVFLTLGISPIAAWLAVSLGNRLTLALGVVLATLGLASAGVYIDMTFSDFGVLRNKSDIETPVISDINVPHPNILVLYATVGILTGVGFGLTYLPSMTVIKTHFRVNLGLACGVAQAGTGFGQFVMAPIINVLLRKYNLAVVLYFFSAIFFASFPLCFLFKEKKSENEEKSENDEKKSDSESTWKELLNVMRTPSKLLLVIHVFLLNIGIYAVFTFFADRAISFGISETKSSTLVSIIGFSNFLARILSGVLVDKFRSRTLTILTVIHLVNGVSILLSQFLTSFPAQAVAAAIFGAGFGTKVTCMVVLVSLIDENVTHLLSVIYLSVGVSSLIGPSFIGYLLDTTGSHLSGFITVSVLFILGALCLPFAWILHQKREKYISTKM